MASTPPYSFYKIFTPFPTSKLRKYPPVRSQRFGDEGKSANLVDANMSTLRKRIEQQRMKERLSNEAWYNGSREKGWNYKAGHDDNYKIRGLLVESFQLAALVGRTIGLVFIFGSFFVFLYSLLLMHVQMHQS